MLSRRSFLTLAIGLIPCGPGTAWPARQSLRATDRTRLLSTLVGDTAAAEAIGRDALSLYPDLLDRTSANVMLKHLGVQIETGDPVEVTAVRARYEAALREDFAASRTIDVHGWQLARTEVRVFALLAIGSPRTQ